MNRIYVKVVAEFSAEGKSTPLRMEYNDQWYDIDKLIQTEPHGSVTGPPALRYTVRIWSQTRFLWRDGDKWFVEVTS